MRIRPLSLLSVGVLTGAILVAPVVTPAWAAPHPVKPTVRTQPLAGVDAAALAADPPAFDPSQLDSAGPAKAPRVAASRRPNVLTTQIQPGRFTAAGVTWTGATSEKDVVVQARIREKGAWSDWQSLETDGGPDPKSADAKRAGSKHASAPISSADADAIQVRVDASTTPADLALMTVDPGSSAADANLTAAPPATAHGDTTAPAFLTRAQWGADESLRTCSPSYSRTLKVGFVHHTVNSNNYSPAESAGIVRGIYAFHVNGNGWCDVGYNFLVDRYGQIFEGRAGGADRPVIGAQAGGFNTDSFGVAAIGDFTSATPPAAMLSQMSRVLGWKLGLHARDPRGRTSLTSAGGPYTSYPEGTVVPLNVVSGHRDVDITGCPMGVYPYLGSMRDQAGTYTTANTFRSEDLFAVVPTGTATGKVEIHTQSASSYYSQRMLDAATSIASGNTADWRFFVGSSMSDTRPDLIAVHNNRDTGRTDIHVASWASYYRDTVVNTISPAGPTDFTNTEVAVGGPGGGNVYFIPLRGTGSGKVEVHGLDASTNYTTWNQHAATTLGLTYPSTTNRFLIAPGSGDLYLVAHGATGSGNTEIHALTAASGYQQFSMHAATPVGPTNDRNVAWSLGTGSPPDVFYLPLNGTGSGAIEAHRLSPGQAYTQWTLHAATSLPPGTYPGWQLGFG